MPGVVRLRKLEDPPDPKEGRVSVFVDESGNVKAVKEDGDVVPIGGGIPVSSNSFFGFGPTLSGVTADGSFHTLTWPDLVAGDELFDLTDPTEAVVIEAGTYAAWVTVHPASGLSAGRWFQTMYSVNRDDEDERLFVEQSHLASTEKPQPRATVSIPYYLAEGDRLGVHVMSVGGTGNFAIYEMIFQRIT